MTAKRKTRKTTKKKKTTRKTVRKTAKRKTTAKKTAKRKTTARKTKRKVAKRKTTTRRKVTKRKVAAKPAVKVGKIADALTRTQQIAYIADCTGVAKKDVKAVIEFLEPMIAAHLKGAGQISLAGLMKIVVNRKPATKARKGINPFTGEPTIFKAKPARKVIKVRPLKKLKDVVA